MSKKQKEKNIKEWDQWLNDELNIHEPKTSDIDESNDNSKIRSYDNLTQKKLDKTLFKYLQSYSPNLSIIEKHINKAIRKIKVIENAWTILDIPTQKISLIFDKDTIPTNLNDIYNQIFSHIRTALIEINRESKRTDPLTAYFINHCPGDTLQHKIIYILSNAGETIHNIAYFLNISIRTVKNRKADIQQYLQEYQENYIISSSLRKNMKIKKVKRLLYKARESLKYKTKWNAEYWGKSVHSYDSISTVSMKEREYEIILSAIKRFITKYAIPWEVVQKALNNDTSTDSPALNRLIWEYKKIKERYKIPIKNKRDSIQYHYKKTKQINKQIKFKYELNKYKSVGELLEKALYNIGFSIDSKLAKEGLKEIPGNNIFDKIVYLLLGTSYEPKVIEKNISYSVSQQSKYKGRWKTQADFSRGII